jgi:hypothetical protein
MTATPHPIDFFGKLRWLDGKPLLDTIEPYRRRIFTDVLYSFDGDRPRYNLALCGRAKKNWKTADLILAGLYRMLVWPSPQGNDAFVLANDEGQAQIAPIHTDHHFMYERRARYASLSAWQGLQQHQHAPS